MSVSTMLKKDRDGTLFKLRRVGIDLDSVRDKTLDAIADWTKKNRYAQVIEDVENLSEKVSASEFGKNSAGYDLQGKTEVQGLKIAIENQPGSIRSGKNEDGSEWKTTFKSPYGYIEGTKGADGEEVDAYVGPDKDSTQAFIVHQKKQDGSHDEDTVMLGYKTKGDAKTDILRHYDDTSLIGGIDQMSVEALKGKLEAAGDKPIKKIADMSQAIGELRETPMQRRLRRLAARRSPDPDAEMEELDKWGSGLASEQASLDYRDGDAPGMTGIPASMGRKKWEGPSRVMEDPYPLPKVENRQELQETKHVAPLSPVEGFEDTGKYAELGVDRALGDERKSWEGPTRDAVGASLPEKHRLRTATGAEAVEKLASLERAIREAFLEELFEISEANGVAAWRGDFEKFASSRLVDDMVKQALFSQLAGGLKRGLVGGVSPQGIPMKGILSGFKGVGHRMEQAGTQMMTSPAQRIRAAGASAGEARQLAQQAQRFGVKGPGVAKRIGGEAVQTAGKHVSHSSPLQLAINPVGTVVGGGIEGATRGAGRELVRSTGLAGQAGAGGIRAGLGRAMQQHAGKAGVVGEIGTLGAMGGMLHLPLSGAGALGSGIAHASPVIGHGLAALGQVGAHVGADAIGTITQKASRLIPHAAKATGRLLQASA